MWRPCQMNPSRRSFSYVAADTPMGAPILKVLADILDVNGPMMVSDMIAVAGSQGVRVTAGTSSALSAMRNRLGASPRFTPLPDGRWELTSRVLRHSTGGNGVQGAAASPITEPISGLKNGPAVPSLGRCQKCGTGLLLLETALDPESKSVNASFMVCVNCGDETTLVKEVDTSDPYVG